MWLLLQMAVIFAVAYALDPGQPQHSLPALGLVCYFAAWIVTKVLSKILDWLRIAHAHHRYRYYYKKRHLGNTWNQPEG
jgi:hypothetical protein